MLKQGLNDIREKCQKRRFIRIHFREMSNWCKKSAFLVILLCIGIVESYSQSDSIVMDCNAPVSIVRFNRNFPNSLSIHTDQLDTNLEKAFANYDLAEGLKLQNTIHVKSYGTGLQSVAFRGTGAEHTAVSWNGVPLNSTLNGQVDFSLLPSFFVDDLFIDFGTGATGVGSGAVGGAVQTESGLNFRPHSEGSMILTLGSFGFRNNGFGYSWSNGKLSSKSRIFNQENLGNFKYKNKFKVGSPEERMEGNSASTYSAMQQIGYKTGKHVFDLSVWGLTSTRHFGKPNNQGSKDQQDDNFLKSVITHQFRPNKKLKIRTLLSHSYDYLKYQNIGVFADDYEMHQWTANVNTSYKVNRKLVLTSRLEYFNVSGDSENFTDDDARRTIAGHTASILYQHRGNFHTKLSVNNQVSNTETLPVLLGIGMGTKLRDNIVLTGSVNQVYRLPTLNELYWVGAGNVDLKPESGWKEDVNLKWRKNGFKTEFSVYHILLDDWLIWLPEGSVWKPKNIRKVRSRGVEIFVSKRFQPNGRGGTNKKGKKIFLDLAGQYTYTRSSNEEVETGNEDALDKQLIYVPYHKAGITVSGGYEKWFLRTRTNYTGKMFSSSTNDSELDAFTLLSLSMGREVKIKGTEAIWSLSVKNLFDERYELIEGQPVPGRTFWLKINLILKNNKKQK